MARKKSRAGRYKSKAKKAGKKAYRAAKSNPMLTGLLVGGVVGYAAAKMMGDSNSTTA